MGKDASVFISYARSEARREAVAIYQALGGADAQLAFLDTDEIKHGEPFPERLASALLNARIVVILPTPAYFTRWYCGLELKIATEPFSILAARTGLAPCSATGLECAFLSNSRREPIFQSLVCMGRPAAAAPC